MIERLMKDRVIELAQQMPVVAILGPRQSGKTTLARAAFPQYNYVTLEDLELREYAQRDPRGFLATYHHKEGVILDEFQRVPELLSYIQVEVDESKRLGYFILTGSQNFLMLDAITQSLAGRIALFTLLPLSLEELSAAGLLPVSVEELIVKGMYPRPYADPVSSADWYPDYLRTYVERDVRLLRNVEDLSLFQHFLGLCAGRIGQLLNVASLANDCGITVLTAKKWLSLLEASYLIYLLQPYHANFGKRLIKSPKLYFYDTGLACMLLRINSAEQLFTHYLRGGLFESLVITDFFKQAYARKIHPDIYFWRDKTGNEIDCIVSHGSRLTPIEIKAGKTVSQSFFKGIEEWYTLIDKPEHNGVVVYAGDAEQKRSLAHVVGWKAMGTLYADTFLQQK